MSRSLRPHGLQHARLSCPSPTPRAYWNSCPKSWWWHPTISASIVPFSSCFQYFPASGSFQMSQFFTSGSQSIGVSTSALVLPMNVQDWFPLGWTGWISLQAKGLSRVFSNTVGTTVQKGRTKEPLDENEREGKSLLKLNIWKTKIMASGPITSWQIDGEQWKQWKTLFLGLQKSLQMMTAAMKLKDACFLEEKLWPT